MNNELPELLNAKEVMAVLRISRPTLDRLIQAGEIKCVQQKPNGHRKFVKDDILRYIASQLGN